MGSTFRTNIKYPVFLDHARTIHTNVIQWLLYIDVINMNIDTVNTIVKNNPCDTFLPL